MPACRLSPILPSTLNRKIFVVSPLAVEIANDLSWKKKEERKPRKSLISSLSQVLFLLAKGLNLFKVVKRRKGKKKVFPIDSLCLNGKRW